MTRFRQDNYWRGVPSLDVLVAYGLIVRHDVHYYYLLPLIGQSIPERQPLLRGGLPQQDARA